MCPVCHREFADVIMSLGPLGEVRVGKRCARTGMHLLQVLFGER